MSGRERERASIYCLAVTFIKTVAFPVPKLANKSEFTVMDDNNLSVVIFFLKKIKKSVNFSQRQLRSFMKYHYCSISSLKSIYLLSSLNICQSSEILFEENTKC